MALKHETRGNGSGGGGGQKTTVESTRNTITCTETETGWDIDVASEDALRYIIHNYREFMEASVDIGTRYARGETTSCVMQLVDDIFMTDAKAEDEDLYKVNGNKLIDFANKTFKFGWYFFYTTILSDGNRRHLQLLYPDSGHLDTWQFQANRIKFDNVHIGGGIALYNKHNETNYDPQTASFSRYLLASVANLNYTITNCTIACCGANDNSFNPFIHEGNPSVHPLEQYHTNIKIINCDFFHGGDSHGDFWNNLNAPIVIYSDTLFGVNTSHQRIVVLKQLSKNINDDANETGCPHIQFRTVSQADPSYATQKAYWISHPWQLSTDGTALVTNTVDEACIVFEAKLALKDIYLQGNPNLQPENPSPDHNYVSLVEELLARQGRQVIDSQSLEYFIGQITGNNDFVRVDGDIVFFRFFENSNNFIFFDAHGHIDVEKTLYLIPIQGYVQMCGLLYGTNYGESATCQTIYAECGGVGNSILKNSVKGARAQGLRSADIEVIEYNGENYLALVKNWSGGDLFLKGYSNLTQEEIDEDLILLYYDGTRQKWYSDSDLTQEVSFTVLETSGRFPASLDFGGNTSQVVAGDGSLLSYPSSPMNNGGEMTQQAYNDMGSHDPNTIYVITD